MIGFFPAPYPDELFYSLCARYHHRAGYRSSSSTALDLFGARAVAAIDLPGNLNQMIAALPPGHHYSVDQLIDEHTLLRFYAPFLSPERGAQLRYEMAEKGRGSHIHSRAGVMFRAKMQPEFLRYCPACVSEDRQQYNEAYWRRVHQAPGVTVCPHHTAWLEPSSLYVQQRGEHRRFLRAEQLVREAPMRLLNPEDRDHQAHLWIARETRWLLDHFPGANAPKQLRGRYHGLLFARGLASYDGVVRIQKLQEEFSTFYSEGLLSELDCRLDPSWNWLTRLTQPNIRAYHPIYHLLLMRFLRCSAAEFFQLPTVPQPFGAGPWPCLNPACEHYQEPWIKKFEVRLLRIGDQRKNAADFHCVCGFRYSRTIPNAATKSDADHYRVMSCGPIWEEALRQLSSSGKYTRREMAEKLGVSCNILDGKLRKFRRERQEWQDGDSDELAKHKRALAKAEAMELRRTEYRELWREVMRNHPTASRSQLGKIEQLAYSWLRMYDREWFEASSPPRRRNPGVRRVINWKQRDSELASAARTAAERLRQAIGRPVRVTRYAIAREICGVSVITKQSHHLPLTMAVLAEVSESLGEWVVRCLRWAAESFRQEGYRPTAGQILDRAIVARIAIRKKSILKSAIETVMKEFDALEGEPHI